MRVPDWWDDKNKKLEDGCDDFYRCYWYYLCVAYGIVSIIALIQLIRIQIRVPDFGWTTQKVFHLLNFIVCLLRALTFGLYTYMDNLEDAISSHVLQFVIFDLPSLLFFTTFSLLILFWAEIYHQANNFEPLKLRPYFVVGNLLVYIVQGILWLLTIPDYSRNTDRYISSVWLTIVYLTTAIGFLVYGGFLFLMLRKFPIASSGRKRKLREVAGIAAICSIAFIARAAFMFMYVLDKHDFDVDLMEDNLLNIVFYSVCELLPTICVLFILRKLPPKRTKLASSYSAMDDQESLND